jgi:hypothetical protein
MMDKVHKLITTNNVSSVYFKKRMEHLNTACGKQEQSVWRVRL